MQIDLHVHTRTCSPSITECGIAGGFMGRTPRELAAYQLARERGALLQRVLVTPVEAALHPVPGGDGVGLDLGMRTGSATTTSASAP